MFVGGLAFAMAAHSVELKPQEVAPGVYAFIGDMGARTSGNEGMNANTGFIVTGGGVVVIDSGPTWNVARQIHQAIKRVTKQPVKYVVNTGGQDHRWLGNGYFKSVGAEIIAARPILADMQARGGMQLEELRKVLRKKAAGTRPVYPDRYFDREEALDLGGEDIRLFYFHGGHTPGDSVVWLPKAGVLFAGDLVYVDRILGIFPFSSTRNWLASFDGMEQLGPRIIVPGHGRVCGLAQAQRETRDYLRLLRNHMKQAVEQGQDIQSAINSLDQSAFKGLLNYDALKGFNASNTYLEVEQE
jgi:glyoxylase-like metal-dependent hydrolase (beta-lactamase superfamily II)